MSEHCNDLHEELTELGEVLASALYHENIGREITGWREVSEAFGIVKDLIGRTRPEERPGAAAEETTP